MKGVLRDNARLAREGRWDLDYHLPPDLIEQYAPGRRTEISAFARVSKEKRDPSDRPDETFMYIDISSVDVATGAITNPQELSGEEAPSRARMIVHAYDVIVSTCRPTRGAIAVVPPGLHRQICSTGFTVLRCEPTANPFFLQYVLRLPSTMEQFRKFSTGSSYPAILDTDVLKTQVPSASPDEQDAIAVSILSAFEDWKHVVEAANAQFHAALTDAELFLRRAISGTTPTGPTPATVNGAVATIREITQAVAALEDACGDDEASDAQQALL